MTLAQAVAHGVRAPVEPGDRVEIQGELVRAYDDGAPLVHWTHHDPSRRHPDGFIEVAGRVYA